MGSPGTRYEATAIPRKLSLDLKLTLSCTVALWAGFLPGEGRHEGDAMCRFISSAAVPDYSGIGANNEGGRSPAVQESNRRLRQTRRAARHGSGGSDAGGQVSICADERGIQGGP